MSEKNQAAELPNSSIPQLSSSRTDVNEADPRVQLAVERTLLAWMRTGLALMAFGFVVARFALILQTLGVKTHPFFTIKATVIGIILVLLGVVVNIVAPLHYRDYFRRIKVSGANLFTAWSLTLFVAYVLAIVGIALAVYLLLVDLANWR
jgi:putative membrane protein